MPSSSPGYVKLPEDIEDVTDATPDGTRAPARAAVSPVRASVKKRARGSPSTPARSGPLAVLGSLTDTVRASAVRGLRAITDTIERTRDDDASSGSSGSVPPSPTDAIMATTNTPDGKRRRTALTDARTRRTHANWRGAQWDFTSAMRDNNLARVGDTGPSIFAFPDGRPHEGDGPDGAQLSTDGGAEQSAPPRPASAMSAASAPAALSTPSSHAKQGDDLGPASDGASDRGWIVSYTRTSPDPFEATAGAPEDPMATDATAPVDDGDCDDRCARFVDAVRDATALLSHDTINSPDACGALLAFQACLRALDPYGNFTSPPPMGDSTAAEMRTLRGIVEELAEAQRSCTATLQSLVAQRTPPSQAAPARTRTGAPAAQPPTAARPAGTQHVPERPLAQGGGLPASLATTAVPTTPGAASAAPGVITRAADKGLAKPVGRHDVRRAVFRPAVPFGGRIPATSSPDDVRRPNLVSYLVRDSVNASLRERATEEMTETDPVQVTTVNWTERGNLCMVTGELFTAAQLLLHADAAVEAAQLGPGWKACRDVPVHRAVLQGVPTKRADGSLFTEDDVLGDLRAHSAAFNTLSLADSVEPASWISRDDGRALRDTSTIALNFATADDAARFTKLQRCIFVFGRPCEPGEYRPRERERVCRRCWSPLARHRERDHACRELCRLCGKGHAEEEHTCHECDVLARPCEHIPLRCVNCDGRHAADDSACAYRRRTRGADKSAPPMSSEPERHAADTPATAALATGRRKKGKRIRVLDPHEPFPDVPPSAAASGRLPTPTPASTPARPPAAPTTTGGDAPAAAPRHERATRKRTRATKTGNAPAASPAPSTPVQSTAAQLAAGPAALVPPVTPPVPTGQEAAADPELDGADAIALEELVGSGSANTPAPPPPTLTPTPGNGAASGPARRVPPVRVAAAAAEADREARRRRAAHVLRRAFSFLQLPDALSAIRTCSDDYASAVSWAVEEQAKRRKPGMQGKSNASLQKLVTEMSAAAAKDTPAAGTTPTPPPANE